ncbi:hypothetical protein M408DRAFT_185497 [Serendipita vermifera MAFF 305830]|uniref:Uncharacterized protein n=1 Tax=Serendipita vermifera MAFF 305830 TaxID=933852 RepID=A0A0C2XUZ0_SERVB|nr:hypothetical protein M408DRAFT_185497 [Serendipita vermifera MAFF 305830]
MRSACQTNETLHADHAASLILRSRKLGSGIHSPLKGATHTNRDRGWLCGATSRRPESRQMYLFNCSGAGKEALTKWGTLVLCTTETPAGAWLKHSYRNRRSYVSLFMILE